MTEEVRAHAVLSASGAKKWMTCSMSAAREYGMADEGSDFSREGTCAHAVAELRLTQWLFSESPWIKEEAEYLPADLGYEQFFNREFSNHVWTYVDYVTDKIQKLQEEHGQANVEVLLEQRLDFSKWVAQGFGTGDVVIIVPGKIIVIDLKFGAGIFVQGADNAQLKLYGLGAFARYDALYDFHEVEVLIHQPRKDNVSGEVIQVEDLLAWADAEVAPRAAIAWAAIDAAKAGKPMPHGASFTPGEHCSTGFCKARFTCAARAGEHLSIGGLDYALAEPHTLTVAQLEEVAGRASTLSKWAADVKSYLFREANSGRVNLVRFQLSQGRGARVITDDAVAAIALMEAGYSSADIYKAKALHGITALEKLVGAKKLAELLDGLIVNPPGAMTLAPAGSGPVVEPKRSSPDEDFA